MIVSMRLATAAWAGIRRAVAPLAVAVIDLSHDARGADLEDAEVVLAAGIVIGGERFEVAHRQQDRRQRLAAECLDAADHADGAVMGISA